MFIFKRSDTIFKLFKVLFTILAAVSLAAVLNSNSAEANAGSDHEGSKDVSEGPYYYYNGPTGDSEDGAFILDQLFIDGLKNNNFTLNGYWVNAHPDANNEHSQTLEVYDQTLYVNTDDQVYLASFPIDNSIQGSNATIANIEAAYGEPDESNLWYGDGEYTYVFDDAKIVFTFDNGFATYAHVGAKEIEIK